MKVNVSGAGSNTFTEQNCTLDGLYVDITSTTIADVTIADMETIQITANLLRNGEQKTIVGANLWALGQGNNPSSFEGLAIGSHKSFFIAFGGPLNLQDGDTLQCSVTVGATNTGQVTTLSSHYCVGVELYTPSVNVIVFDKTRTTVPAQLGNNVTQITLVNTSTDFVCTDLYINSAIWQAQIGTQEQFCMMAEQWEVTPPHYSLTIYQDAPMDGANASCTVNTSATGNGYLVSYSGMVTPEVKRRSKALTNRIQNSVSNKFGV